MTREQWIEDLLMRIEKLRDATGEEHNRFQWKTSMALDELLATSRESVEILRMRVGDLHSELRREHNRNGDESIQCRTRRALEELFVSHAALVAVGLPSTVAASAAKQTPSASLASASARGSRPRDGAGVRGGCAATRRCHGLRPRHDSARRRMAGARRASHVETLASRAEALQPIADAAVRYAIATNEGPLSEHRAASEALQVACGVPVLGFFVESPVEALRRENEQLRSKVAEAFNETRAALAEASEARSRLAVVEVVPDAAWRWIGDGDEPSSLSCPVVMRAETLREFVTAREERDAIRAALDEGASTRVQVAHDVAVPATSASLVDRVRSATDITAFALDQMAAADEIDRGRKRFPGGRLMLVALMEEVGELEILGASPEGVRKEAIQVAAVAMRIASDGDFSSYHDNLSPLRRASSRVVDLICSVGSVARASLQHDFRRRGLLVHLATQALEVARDGDSSLGDLELVDEAKRNAPRG